MDFGKSIKLDDANDFAFSKAKNSFEINSEEENIVQAVKILLGTIQGELKFYTDFGVDYYELLGTRVSDNNIKHSIESSVIRDPRIKSVDSIDIERNGRTLKLAIAVTTTKNATLEITEAVAW